MLRADELRATHLSKVELPYMAANLHELSRLAPGIQRSLLEIQSQVSFVNQKVELSHVWHRMTCDSALNPGDPKAVRDSLRPLYEDIRGRCRFIADLIGKSEL